MNCFKCNKPAKLKVQTLVVCEGCFVKIIEKRVRKDLRIGNSIRKNDSILVIDDGSAEAKASIFLLKNILVKLPVKLKVKKHDYMLGEEIAGNHTCVILPWSTDSEDEYFLDAVMNNKPHDYLGDYEISGRRYIKLLLHVLREEAELFAKIKCLSFKKNPSETTTGKILARLEKEYPETKFSLLKSTEEIKKNLS